MPMATRYPSGRSQLFTFTRRNLLMGLASVISSSFLQSQSVTPVLERGKPDFSIGDRVWTSWEADGLFRSEVGEVVGTCWHPAHKHWEYLIVWGSTNYFDEQLTDAKGLELKRYG